MSKPSHQHVEIRRHHFTCQRRSQKKGQFNKVMEVDGPNITLSSKNALSTKYNSPDFQYFQADLGLLLVLEIPALE